MTALETGVYTISNVKSMNLVSIANGNDRTPLVSSSGNDSNYSHKWVVTRCHSRRYTIMNQQHMLFARCESRPKEEISEIYASRDQYYWDVEQTGSHFTIRPVDTDLYWTPPDNQHGTPITLGQMTSNRCHWIFSFQPAAIETMLPMRGISTPMQEASNILRNIYICSEQVEIYNHQCNDLVRRARWLFDALNQETEGHGGGSGQRPTMNHVTEGLKYIKDLLHFIAKLSILGSLLRSDEIAKRMEEAHQRLSRITPSEVDSLPFIKSRQDARRMDAQHIEWLAEIKGDEAILKLFKLLPHELKDALVAIYHFVASHQDESVEKGILELAASVFARKSKQNISGQLQSWIISSLEVEIDDTVVLGTGGFGKVSKGVWIRDGSVVAVKQMTRETPPKALLKEINIWKDLSHDNVLPFYGASLTASPPFIVSKYMENGNAVEYLRHNPAANRLQLLHGVALGMSYLHCKDIMHGDLKGYNILIDGTGKACIADFGLSHIRAEVLSRTASTAAMGDVGAGTLRFMAPEQMKGKMIKPSDVYSFGMLMFEVFTGTVPFHVIPDHCLFAMIAENSTRLERPLSAEVVRRGLTEESWKLIWSCTEPQPSARPTFRVVEPKLQELAINWHHPTGGNEHESRDDFDINLDELGYETAPTTINNDLELLKLPKESGLQLAAKFKRSLLQNNHQRYQSYRSPTLARLLFDSNMTLGKLNINVEKKGKDTPPQKHQPPFSPSDPGQVYLTSDSAAVSTHDPVTSMWGSVTSACTSIIKRAQHLSPRDTSVSAQHLLARQTSLHEVLSAGTSFPHETSLRGEIPSSFSPLTTQLRTTFNRIGVAQSSPAIDDPAMIVPQHEADGPTHMQKKHYFVPGDLVSKSKAAAQYFPNQDKVSNILTNALPYENPRTMFKAMGLMLGSIGGARDKS